MSTFVCLLLLALCAHVALGDLSSPLYAIVTDFGANNTETTVYTVQIGTDGKKKDIVENFRYVGSSISFDGISTFDQKDKVLYYAPDFESGFVFAVDVTKGALLPTVSVDATIIQNLQWDSQKDAVLAEAVYANAEEVVQFMLLVSFSTSGNSPAQIAVNFTSQFELKTVYQSAVANGIYYIIYPDASEAVRIGSFPLADPKTLKSSPLSCGSKLFVTFMAWDDTSKALIGVGEANVNNTLQYSVVTIDPSNGQCSAKVLPVNGIVTCTTFNPKTRSLFFGVAPNGPAEVYEYSFASGKTTSVKTEWIPEELQVSYSV